MPLVARVISSALFNTACNLRVYALHIRSPLLPRFIQSRPLSVYSFGILGHALSRGGQDISLKVYRVFFVNETEEQSEKFRRNKSSYGAIYLQTLLLPPLPPFFLPPPSRYSFWNISQSPLSFSLSLSRPPQTLVSTPFFFFVSFFRHRLSVTHCPSAATMCSVLQNCTRYVKRKNFGVQTRNTLVAVLKRVFPRFCPLLPVL